MPQWVLERELLFLFCRWENKGTEWLDNLPCNSTPVCCRNINLPDCMLLITVTPILQLCCHILLRLPIQSSMLRFSWTESPVLVLSILLLLPWTCVEFPVSCSWICFYQAMKSTLIIQRTLLSGPYQEQWSTQRYWSPLSGSNIWFCSLR